MKRLLIIFVLFISVCNAQEFEVISSKNKFGLNLTKPDGSKEILLKPVYNFSNEIDGGVIFFDKKKNKKTNAVIVLHKGKFIKELGDIILLDTYYIIHKMDKQDYFLDLKLINSSYQSSLSSDISKKVVFDYDLYDQQFGIQLLKNGKKGLMNLNTKKIVIPCLFDEISTINDYVQVKNGNRYGIYHYDSNKILCDTIYIQAFDNKTLFDMEMVSKALPATKNEKSCLCYLKNGLNEVCFDEIDPILKGERYEVKRNTKYGMISEYGDTILPIEYDEITYLIKKDNYVMVEKNDSLYLFDYFENVFTGPGLTQIIPDKKNNSYQVEIGNKKGIVADHDLMIPIEYDEFKWVGEFLYARAGNLWGAFDNYYTDLIEPKYKTEEELNKALEDF